MAAPSGNKFWELRSKHGRDKIFSDKEVLKNEINEYFKATSQRYLGEQDWVGKDAQEVIKTHYVPFTIQGLCTFLDISVQTWENYKKREGYQDFFEIITRAEQIIYQQKFEGAACGFYNPSIIARELGLTDKSNIEHSGQIKGNDQLTDDQFAERMAILKRHLNEH